MLPFIVFAYFTFHSWLLGVYDYDYLSKHMVFITLIHLYMVFYKQSSKYLPIREIAQLQSKRQNQSKQIKQCVICKKVKPSRYYHCRRCNICIYRMDHHCQWVGNCIGQYNAKPYFYFLFHLFIHSLIAFVYIFVLDFNAISVNEDRKAYLFALIIPVVFILYETQRLLKEFYSSIKENQTLIESYKLVKGKNQSILVSLGEFFGSQNAFMWMIPFCLPFENSEKSLKLYEETFSMNEQEKSPQDHTYADEYLYGKDDEDNEHQGCNHHDHGGHEH